MQNVQQQSSVRRRAARIRNCKRGYVLVLCMIVIAISSSIVLTTFQLLKLHTAEASARRDLVTIAAIQTAGTEHAIAHLIDQPTFRGSLGAFPVPNQSQQRYLLQITYVWQAHRQPDHEATAELWGDASADDPSQAFEAFTTRCHASC